MRVLVIFAAVLGVLLTPYSSIFLLFAVTPILSLIFFHFNTQVKFSFGGPSQIILAEIFLLLPCLNPKETLSSCVVNQLPWMLVALAIFSCLLLLRRKARRPSQKNAYLGLKRFSGIIYLFFYFRYNDNYYSFFEPLLDTISHFTLVRTDFNRGPLIKLLFEGPHKLDPSQLVDLNRLKFYLFSYGNIFLFDMVMFSSDYILMHRYAFDFGRRGRLIMEYPECRDTHLYFRRRFEKFSGKVWRRGPLVFFGIYFIANIFFTFTTVNSLYPSSISVTDLDRNVLAFVNHSISHAEITFHHIKIDLSGTSDMCLTFMSLFLIYLWLEFYFVAHIGFLKNDYRWTDEDTAARLGQTPLNGPLPFPRDRLAVTEEYSRPNLSNLG